MKIIDFHTHWYPAEASANTDEFARKNGELYWGALVGKRADGKPSLQSFPTQEEFLGAMECAGICKCVIQGWYWQNTHTCDKMNECAAEFARRYPDRIAAFASLNPRDIAHALRMVGRARSLGFSGIGELHDGVQEFDYSSAEFDNLARACADQNLPICLHITEQSGREYPGKTPTNTEAAIECARRNPRTKFVFAHWCGLEFFKRNLALENVFFDSAATPFIKRDAISQAALHANANKCIFGSDYPLRLYPRLFKTAEMAAFANRAKTEFDACERTKKLFFHENAQNLLSPQA